MCGGRDLNHGKAVASLTLRLLYLKSLDTAFTARVVLAAKCGGRDLNPGHELGRLRSYH